MKPKTKTIRVRKAFPVTNRKPNTKPYKTESTYNSTYYPSIAYSACKNTGCDNTILGELFGVGRNTIATWCFKYPEFGEAVRKGKDEYDSEVVEKRLLSTALGYEYQEETWERKKTGYEVNPDTLMLDKDLPKYEMVLTKIEKKQKAPNPTSIIFWLVNREKERWAHVNKVVNQYPDGVPVVNHNTINIGSLIQNASEEELKMLDNMINQQNLIEASGVSTKAN